MSLPKRYRPSPREAVTASCRNCSDRSIVLAGEPVSFAEVPLEEAGERRSRTRSRAALRAVPWGEVVTYGELSAPRAEPAPHALRERSVPRTGSRSSPATGSSRPAASAATAGSASSTSVASCAWKAGAMGLRTIYARAGGDRAQAWLLPAGGASLRSSTRPGASTSAAAARLRSTSTPASSAIARRSFSLLRRLSIDSEIRTYNRRAFDRATRYQLHVEGDPHALATLVEAGVLDARHAPERPPKRVVGRVLSRLLPARSAPRRRVAVGAAAPSPRAADDATRGRGLPPSRRCCRRRPFLRDRGRYAVAYAKGLDAIEAVLNSPVRATPCSPSRNARWSRPRAPRRTGSPTPITQTWSGRAARRRNSSRRCARPAGDGRARAAARTSVRGRTPPAPLSAAAAARARRPV